MTRPTPESSFDTRRTSPSEKALENTAHKLYNTLDRLKDWGVSPDSCTVDTQRIPFGQFGDGYLATSITDDDGLLSAILSFRSSHDRPGDSFLLTRGINDEYWQGKNRRLSNEGVLHYLDAYWPQQIIDNSAIRRAMDQKNHDIGDVFKIISENLEPSARYILSEKIYGYRSFFVDGNSGSCRDVSLSVGIKTDQDGFTSVSADITQPYVCNTLPTELHSRICVDEMGTPSITSWYVHPTRNTPCPVPVKNTPALCAEFELMLEQMADEKIFGQTKEI